MNGSECCGNCRFFGRGYEQWKWTAPEYANKGRCRRYAPSSNYMQQEIRKDEWCGDYEPAVPSVRLMSPAQPITCPACKHENSWVWIPGIGTFCKDCGHGEVAISLELMKAVEESKVERDPQPPTTVLQ